MLHPGVAADRARGRRDDGGGGDHDGQTSHPPVIGRRGLLFTAYVSKGPLKCQVLRTRRPTGLDATTLSYPDARVKSPAQKLSAKSGNPPRPDLSARRDVVREVLDLERLLLRLELHDVADRDHAHDVAV